MSLAAQGSLAPLEATSIPSVANFQRSGVQNKEGGFCGPRGAKGSLELPNIYIYLFIYLFIIYLLIIHIITTYIVPPMRSTVPQGIYCKHTHIYIYIYINHINKYIHIISYINIYIYHIQISYINIIYIYINIIYIYI